MPWNAFFIFFKKQQPSRSQPPLEQRALRSQGSMAASSAHSSSIPVASSQHAKHLAVKMAQQSSPASGSPDDSSHPSQEIEVDTAAITGPILEAIAASKYELMRRIDLLASECDLVRHDLDKIRGRLNTAEDRISEVEDVSHAHGSQLEELKGIVRSLQHRADDAEDHQ